ncbi:ATP-binding protein [Methylobacterium sp. WSM2598]|uniref:ATP-binding protein n=1 Tax=Methylobacterium sp. WSM2598 TaxID=398261 RepID=UPI00039AAD3F|nr:ATP-binding protein [Methylobacterium sp. WSM2598]
MVDTRTLDKAEADRVIAIEEGPYHDVKRIAVAPAKLSQSVSAFANTGGGELFIGIAEIKDAGAERREWQGFADREDANGHIHAIENLSPLGNHYQYEFLKCEVYPGLVLHIIVFKTLNIINSTGGTPYIRKNAANLPVRGDEALKRLRLDKGIETFENEAVDVDPTRITSSNKVVEFMLDVVPAANPEDWLPKQNLLRGGKPTVAGLMLFDDEPQSVIPKRSAVKIYRYKTKMDEGDRATLAFTPLTIEGCAYDLIYSAVSKTKELIEDIERLGPKGLESVAYPDETLHEIITNAVLHRDYSIADDIHIRIFDNRVEVESPGRLSGHVTRDNIRTERSIRNPQLVRIINKFPNPPNKDIGEGINTAFAAMKTMKLKEPTMTEKQNSFLVDIRHEPLASPAVAVMEYLKTHDRITNSIGRDLTGIRSENSMKDVFLALKRSGVIEPVPGLKGSASAWQKATGGDAPVTAVASGLDTNSTDDAADDAAEG